MLIQVPTGDLKDLRIRLQNINFSIVVALRGLLQGLFKLSIILTVNIILTCVLQNVFQYFNIFPNWATLLSHINDNNLLITVRVSQNKSVCFDKNVSHPTSNYKINNISMRFILTRNKRLTIFLVTISLITNKIPQIKN